MKQLFLSTLALLFLAGCGLTPDPIRCDHDLKWFHGECVEFDRGDKDRDHDYSGPDHEYNGPNDDDEGHPNSGRGNGSEGDPDEDPGESGDVNNGGD